MPPAIYVLPMSLSFLKCLPFHPTTVGRIATRIVALTPPIKTYYRYKCDELAGPVTPEILWLICMDNDCTWAKIRRVIIFKSQSLGGSSVAIL